MLTEIEAVLLNGGASRRMGRDKARLPVNGVPMVERIVSSLLAEGIPVTVLGRPVEGTRCVPDSAPLEGPLVALSEFKPERNLVFVCSCDLPEFDARLVGVLANFIGEAHAAVPVIEGKAQPLCALYSSSAWPVLDRTMERGKRSMMAWLDTLKWTAVPAETFERAGIRADSVLGVNTPEEFRSHLET